MLINERRKLTNAEFNVNNVQNLVQDLIWNIFIQTFNAKVNEFLLEFSFDGLTFLELRGKILY